MAFKKPDVKGPRFRKHEYDPLTGESKALITLLKNKYNVTEKKIRAIIKDFNSTIWKTAIENRDGISLPQQLGTIFIGACQKKTKPNPDFRNAYLYDKWIENRNFPSDSYVCKIFYTNYNNRWSFSESVMWKFKGSREFTRTTSKEFRKNYNRFIVIDKQMQVNRILRKNKI